MDHHADRRQDGSVRDYEVRDESVPPSPRSEGSGTSLAPDGTPEVTEHSHDSHDTYADALCRSTPSQSTGSSAVAEEDEEDEAGGGVALQAQPADDDVLDLVVLDVDDDDLDGDEESMRSAVQSTTSATGESTAVQETVPAVVSPARGTDDPKPGPGSEPEAAVSIVGADDGAVVAAVSPPAPPAPQAPPPAPPPARAPLAYYRGLGKRLEPFAPMAVPVDPRNPGQMRERFAAIERFRAENALQRASPSPSPSPLRLAGLALADRDGADSGPLFCRICRDVDEALAEAPSRLVSPCLCRGSVARVHVGCLERWLAESDTSGCELCGHQYTTVRTPNYNVLTSIPAWMFHNGSTDLIFDFVAFVIFTPVAVFGTQMGLGADDNTYLQVTLMAAIDFVYTAWLAMRLHYHALRWYSWWRRKSTVKVILDAEGTKDQLHES